MGTGASGPPRADSVEGKGDGLWPFRNWLEWVQSSKKIMGFKPTVDFLNLISSPNTTLQAYVRAIIDEVMRTLDADRCSIFFVDELRKEVWCVGSLDMEPFCMPWDKGIVGMVAHEGQIVNLPDAHSHPAFDGEIEKKTGYTVKGLLSLPVKSSLNLQKTIGVIQVLNKRSANGSFAEQDAVELQKIAMVIGDSFHRQRYNILETVFESKDNEVSTLLNQHRERPAYSSTGSVAPGMSTPPEILRSLSRQPFLRAHSPLQVDDLVSLDFDALSQKEDFLEELVPDILKHAGCIENCKIPEAAMVKWAEKVHQGYRENPFHNFFHGFAVYQMCFHQLSKINTFSQLTSTEGFGLLVSALCHDVDHPGVTNAFLIRNQDDLALRYNDVSVLENHHASVACTLLREGSCNIGSGLDAVEQGVFRKSIIKCILATDMAHHQGLCQRLIGCNSAEDFQQGDSQLLMNVCVHAADLSAQVLRWDTARKWEDRICQEFVAQAQKETELGFTPEPFMQFKMEDMKQRGKLQRNFVDFVLRPLWEPYAQLEPQLQPCLTNLIKNRNLYELRRIYGSDQLDEMPDDMDLLLPNAPTHVAPAASPSVPAAPSGPPPGSTKTTPRG